jgi:3-(3-hydroxy-phenyl)propionate hydroxylase
MEARDVRLLSEGGGHPRTVTRQEIVPPLQKGLLAFPLQPAHGTLFPQPWIRTAAGRRLLDIATGTGWRVVLDERNAPDLTADVRADLTRLGMRLIRVRSKDAAGQAEQDVVAEEDGVLESWFDRHGCRAAIVRPDHYVFGVANDKSALAKMLSELATRLQ